MHAAFPVARRGHSLAQSVNLKMSGILGTSYGLPTICKFAVCGSSACGTTAASVKLHRKVPFENRSDRLSGQTEPQNRQCIEYHEFATRKGALIDQRCALRGACLDAWKYVHLYYLYFKAILGVFNILVSLLYLHLFFSSIHDQIKISANSWLLIYILLVRSCTMLLPLSKVLQIL